MDPDELYDICYPVINEDIDYVKGNRLGHKAARILIPATRRIGNSILSAMTKISSGYWRISDTQTGYTAISLRALNRIDIYHIYKNYGMPNDMLIKLNIAKCTIKEIPIKPVYNVGEQSKMSIIKVIPKISVLLYLGFWKRIIKKYCFKDFHPIFFFYLMGAGAFGGSLYFLFYIITRFFRSTRVTDGTYQGFVVMFITSLLCTGLAMWFDMYDNDRLQK